MCLAVPMKIKKIKGDMAAAEVEGLEREINVGFLANVKPGDYVVVHAGFAIEKVNEKKAKETLTLFDEIHGRI